MGNVGVVSLLQLVWCVECKGTVQNTYIWYSLSVAHDTSSWQLWIRAKALVLILVSGLVVMLSNFLEHAPILTPLECLLAEIKRNNRSGLVQTWSGFVIWKCLFKLNLSGLLSKNFPSASMEESYVGRRESGPVMKLRASLVGGGWSVMIKS